jgi:hypothetical protein
MGNWGFCTFGIQLTRNQLFFSLLISPFPLFFVAIPFKFFHCRSVSGAGDGKENHQTLNTTV